MNEKLCFDKNFMIGAATSAHQVEGNNRYSDNWVEEHMVNTSYKETSGIACDHYNRYEEDIRIMAEAGLNAYRFSIEWARIEPDKGRYDKKEIIHYQDVIHTCKKYGLEPVVTLHHFTSPKWLMKEGGWESEKTPEYFGKYVRYVCENIGKELNYICTINEANMRLQITAIAERYRKSMLEKGVSENQNRNVQLGIDMKQIMEKQKAAADEREKVFGIENVATFLSPGTEKSDLIVMKAHEEARRIIRELCPQAKVGLTLSLHDLQPMQGAEIQAQMKWNEEFFHYLPYIAEDDFLGVQNYTRTILNTSGEIPVPEGMEKTQMGYEFYPEALGHVVRKVTKDFHGELLVTENGVAVSEDERRKDFILKALHGIKGCIVDGVPIKGYFYWSLLDNFEFAKGYDMTFGLVAVDRNTMERTPKPSLAFLGSMR